MDIIALTKNLSNYLGRNPTPEELEKCVGIEEKFEKIASKIKKEFYSQNFTGRAINGDVLVIMDNAYTVKDIIVAESLWEEKRLVLDAIKTAIVNATMEANEGILAYNSRINIESTKSTLEYYSVFGIEVNEKENIPKVLN